MKKKRKEILSLQTENEDVPDVKNEVVDPCSIHEGLLPNSITSSSKWKPLCVAAVVLGIYVKTLHPSVPGGDSGELITAAHELGVAHPPGYPLFTMMAKCMIDLCPFGSPAWRINLLTGITSAAASGLMFATTERLTGRSSAGLLAVVLFSLSQLTWHWSTAAEVFGLNNLLVALLMLLAVLFEHSQADKKSCQMFAVMGSFVCGLCLSNQHTSILYIICIVPWALAILYAKQYMTIGLIFKLCLAFFAGLLPYAYLPVSAYMQSGRWTWGDQRTLGGFFTHLLRREYGTFDLLKNHTGQGVQYNVRLYLQHVYTDLTPAGFLLAMFSVIAAVKRYSHHHKASCVCIFYLMLVFYITFLGWRANLNLKNPLFLGVVERFWIQSDMVTAVLAAVMFVDFIDMVKWLIDLPKWRLDLMFTVVIAVLQLHRNYHACDESNNFVIKDFAMSVLKSLPPNAFVLTKGDLPSNSLRYFHLCENVRPDITLFDQEVLTHPWSLVMMGAKSPGIEFPGDFMQLQNGILKDGRKSFTFKSLLNANIKKHPIFGCVGVQNYDSSWQKRYELWRYGVCSQFIKKGSSLNLSQWVNQTRELGFEWEHPLSSFPDTSWERIATEEMWAAKTASAFFLLNKADGYEAGPEKTALLLYSYQLYTEAFRRHRSAPSYWHKNFALACERLRHTDAKLDQKELMLKTLKHFRIYLKMEPADAEYEKIQNAVDVLQSYVNQLESTS